MQQLDKKAVWLFFFNSFAGILFPLFIGLVYFTLFVVDFLTSGEGGDFSLYGSLIGIVVIVVLVIAYVVAKLSYHYYRYEMSELVFKKEHGIIWKKYVSIPYDRIQNVDIHRGIIARLLGLSDLQIQTAGGITISSYGAFSEGRLVGLSKEEAERLRDELILRARNSRTGQGL